MKMSKLIAELESIHNSAWDDLEVVIEDGRSHFDRFDIKNEGSYVILILDKRGE